MLKIPDKSAFVGTIKTAPNQMRKHLPGPNPESMRLDWRAAMQSTENWEPIPGYEGLYEVSDFGRVRSLDRVDALGRTRVGNMLTPTGLRHLHVTLSQDGKKRQPSVHRLVLEAFVGPCPAGQEGCHRDDDPANNRLTNLRWDTRPGNVGDRQRNGRQARGERVNTAKLTTNNVMDIRARVVDGESQYSIASRYGVDQSSISLIASGKRWGQV